MDIWVVAIPTYCGEKPWVKILSFHNTKEDAEKGKINYLSKGMNKAYIGKLEVRKDID